ncbi:MAG: nitroreductase family deazaflavin-dependent oxidoreductase [Ilumatobacter sp.]|nr:nitroreductase family deazaflavin-dependent oxidoreductase [Ilumatobacter sp.]
MALQDSLADTQMKLMNLVHRSIRTLSLGRVGNTVGSMPVVELHAVGRKSGKTRMTMLTTPLHKDGSYVIVASKGGDDRDPEWYLNIVANPDATLVIENGIRVDVTARTATAIEKAEMWPKIVDAYKGYANYAKKTDRNIPVVICEPRTPSQP